MKRILLLSLAVIMILSLLTACGGDEYRDDLTSAQVMEKIKTAIPSEEGYRQVSESYISASMWGENYTVLLENITDHCIIVSEKSDVNIDEVGVFHVKDSAKVAELKAIVEAYVEGQTLRFRDLLISYNPDELPKLDEAEVEVCGNYIYYSILSEARTEAAENAFEGAIKITK
ncbi:MAG: DUF4358 domain-containing protein [Clostridia bacterium]|nr:DUF4358 domain-containing protein [Clostridia bacterium]